jgi:hypothetical protein
MRFLNAKNCLDLHFSAIEWFNPAYQPHGKPSFPGGLSVNPYTGECCDPFVGYKPVNDFLQESEHLFAFPDGRVTDSCSSKTPDGNFVL